MLGLKRHTVKLTPHHNKWGDIFSQVKKELLDTIGEYVLDIQHIGSTAIKGIYAKPILDIVIAIENKKVVQKFKDKLEAIGYEYRGDAGNAGGELFVKSSEPDMRTQHLHCFEIADPQWENYLSFRDYLNSNKKVAQEYSRLKEELAKKYHNSRKSYTDAKSKLISKILQDTKVS